MALAGAPELAVKLLKDRLRGPEPKVLDALIAKLASEEFAEREAAEKGTVARPGVGGTGPARGAEEPGERGTTRSDRETARRTRSEARQDRQDRRDSAQSNAGDDWLVVTPEGLFDGSEGAWRFLIYREPGTPKLYDDDATRRLFHRPGLLARVWNGEK